MPDPRMDPIRIQRLLDLLETPRTIEELMTALGVKRRSVYRYLTRLEESGAEIVGTLSRPTKYRIL